MSDSRHATPGELAGKPSDEVPAILATGRSDIAALFVSMSKKHPDGADADYLRWHTLDHRPEQQRLAAVRTSLRVVSTPACRRARAACDGHFADVDHVMIYFFGEPGGLEAFGALSDALRDAGRSPFILPPVERGVYGVDNRIAASRARVGADVLPWLPLRGIYLLIEQGRAEPGELTDAPEVAGAWTGESVSTPFSSAEGGQRLTLCFLDGDPLDAAGSLDPLLRRRWQSSEVRPLFAAPFHAVVPYAWDRYLPQDLAHA